MTTKGKEKRIEYNGKRLNISVIGVVMQVDKINEPVTFVLERTNKKKAKHIRYKHILCRNEEKKNV